MKKSRKEFIIKGHAAACSEWKANIEKEFPKLFKKDELEVGKWYRRNSELLVWNGGKNTYGFAGNGLWGKGLLFSGDETGLATDKEVETALIKEGLKRGFNKGVRFTSSWNSEMECKFNGMEYDKCSNSLSSGIDRNDCMFQNGKWATIIETITKADAETQLGKTIID